MGTININSFLHDTNFFGGHIFQSMVNRGHRHNYKDLDGDCAKCANGGGRGCWLFIGLGHVSCVKHHLLCSRNHRCCHLLQLIVVFNEEQYT